MSNTQQILEKGRLHTSRNYDPFPVAIERAEGVWCWDADGRRYLDLLGSYSAVNHGHRHPRIVAAAKAQLDRLPVLARCLWNEPLVELAAQLARLTGLDRVMPMNSGAEAVESAIKVARAWGHRVKGVPQGRGEIVVCAGNFHGRTTTLSGFSTEPSYRDPFAPATPGFVVIPYGDAEALERAIGPTTIAFLAEPLQGEGGILLPPKGWLARVREICTRRGVALIWDEVQTGLGRTGRLFCFEHEDARPDLLCVGKALGGGILPVSACVGRAELMDAVRPGEHGSTFGGSPLAMAVAREALAVTVEERLAERAAELGPLVMARLREARLPGVRDVRGMGLLVGIELEERLGGALRLCELLLRRGVIAKDTRKHVLRLAPPLVIEQRDLASGIEHVADAIRELAGAAAA